MITDEDLRNRLAKPTLERIRADARRVGKPLGPLLRTIARRLFDEGFNVNALWQEHGITSRSASAWFHELKTAPKGYIETARHEVARRLLRESALPIWQVAQVLGLSERTFTRSFKQRANMTAEEFRESGGPKRSFDVDARLAKGLVGELSEDQDAALREGLKDATVRVRSLRPSDETPVDAVRESELYHVEVAIWPRLASLSFAEQRELVRDCRPFFTPAFYDFLHRKSREEGRRDRQRGVDLALLALDTVEANEKHLKDLYPVLRPQARAWIGNARRLALDFFRADDDIRVAVDLLRHTSDPFAAGIVYLCRGTLRMFQRRHEEAIEDYDVALPSFEEAGETSWLIPTLNGRASALVYMEKHLAAIATLQKAKALWSGPGVCSLETEYNMATALARSGRFGEAIRCMDLIEQVTEGDDNSFSWYLITWLKGFIYQGLGLRDAAEEQYLSASRGFDRLGEPVYQALVLLSLTVLYAENESLEAAAEISKKIYPVLVAFPLCEEIAPGLDILKNAVVKVEDLQMLQSRLHRGPLTCLILKGR